MHFTSALVASLALLAMGHCAPSTNTHRLQSRSSMPLSPDEAAQKYFAGRMQAEILTAPMPPPSPHILGANRTGLRRLDSLPKSFAGNVTGGNARLPTSHQEVSFLPGSRQPLNGTSVATNSTAVLFARDCPSPYCCPDPRFVYEDTNWPWRTIGRTSMPLGDGREMICTGTLVGPRHVLTASHCINWNVGADGNLPPFTFQPDYWRNKGDPTAYSGIYVQGGPGTNRGDPTDQQSIGSDFVVVALDVPDGNTFLGWMGYRTYDTAWNGLNVWSHVGYPGTFDSQGEIPALEQPFPINNAWTPGFLQSESGYAIQVAACFTPGDSGGPVFATFTEGPCVGVCVVGVVSGNDCLGPNDFDWTSRCGNYAAGGIDMVNLIRDMKARFP